MLVGLSILHLPCWLLERMRKKKIDVSRSVLTPFSVEGGMLFFLLLIRDLRMVSAMRRYG